MWQAVAGCGKRRGAKPEQKRETPAKIGRRTALQRFRAHGMHVDAARAAISGNEIAVADDIGVGADQDVFAGKGVTWNPAT